MDVVRVKIDNFNNGLIDPRLLDQDQGLLWMQASSLNIIAFAARVRVTTSLVNKRK
jgi:hypothetical protein